MMNRSRFFTGSLLSIVQRYHSLNRSSPVFSAKVGIVLRLAVVLVNQFYTKYDKFKEETAISV